MAGWYKDMFLNEPKKGAKFFEPEPGKIGGIEPDPKTMADPPGPKVVEFRDTCEADVVRTQTAPDGDSVSPVATDRAMSEDMIEMPGRAADGEYEGYPEQYTPGDGADNLFSPR